MSKNPKISVVIPTYNRPDRLKKSIGSVLKQTFFDFEIVIVDDCGENSAENIVKSFNDQRIRYVRHEINKGAGVARNTGIKNSRSKYIAFLDDDDEWLSTKLEEQYNILEKYSNEISYTFCAIELLRGDTKILTKQSFRDDGINNFYKDLLDHRIRMLTSSIMIKKDILDSVGGFDESFPSSQEWELMLRTSKKHRGYCLNKILVKMNYLEGEHIGGNLNRRILGREKLVEKYYQEIKRIPGALARHYFQLGIFCRDNQEFKKAVRYFWKAWFFNKKKFSYFFHFINILSGGVFLNFVKKKQR
jgi:glycosyltransferase involved in cell wall biosynthesis